MEYTTLSNGLRLPLVGFGVFQVPDAAQCEAAVLTALENGYRLIDTAENYLNEEAVGSAVKKSGLPRSEVFITTKLWIDHYGEQKSVDAVHRALERMGTDYIDLILLHQSLGDYYSAWRGLTRLYREGVVKAIGVSNFYPERLTDLCMHAAIRPMVNQIECHPYFQRQTDLECAQHFGVQLEAWGPFAEGGRGIFTDPVLTKIAAAHGKSTAQVMLRWAVQRRVIVLPKSVHADRIKVNIDIFDFALTDAEMQQIAALDTGHTEIIDHLNWHTTEFLNNIKGRQD
ncbi:MAG: aldo/keto reductase [Proteobacteria bacterium]|uniref:Aldo/keto reductase n=1 Tax=Candidatus Avisuccinivibrio stercorigallinarum TaxID=2840704 RepID=A0A9D9DB57_9GAMM|nr:aldo/keto reductase [Candidatus Avisuccinivibrio stercorigallinarum]